MLKIEGFNLKQYNSYHINAVCRVAYFIEKEEDVEEIYRNEDKVIIIGSGHNIILSKDYYDEAFIIMGERFASLQFIGSNKLKVYAGMFSRDLAIAVAEKELSGFEVFYDIPSSIGGAVIMNAGASGEEFSNIVEKVFCYDIESSCFRMFTKEECQFEYRNSYFQKNKNLIVLYVILTFKKGISKDIITKMNLIRDQRHAKQPKDFPNAGSVFKRPEGRFVGPMLDELNLKGFSVGGAQVSEKHSGFIVNKGNATGRDILDLIESIQIKVKNHFNVDLEVEQRII